MVKAECNEGATKVAINGKLKDILADTCTIVRAVWMSIKEDDEDAAEMFKKFFEENSNKIFMDPEDIEKVTGRKKIEKYDELLELLKKANELLDDISED